MILDLPVFSFRIMYSKLYPREDGWDAWFPHDGSPRLSEQSLRLADVVSAMRSGAVPADISLPFGPVSLQDHPTAPRAARANGQFMPYGIKFSWGRFSFQGQLRNRPNNMFLLYARLHFKAVLNSALLTGQKSFEKTFGGVSVRDGA